MRYATYNAVIIYRKGKTIIEIYPVWIEGGGETEHYCIKRIEEGKNDHCLGMISFSEVWKQYTTKFSEGIEWTSGCKKKIAKFEDKINRKWRRKVKE